MNGAQIPGFDPTVAICAGSSGKIAILRRAAMSDDPNAKSGQTPSDPRVDQPKPAPDSRREPVPPPAAERPKDEEFPIEKKIRAI
jgi:hypothetical protein